jgi:paraquat-inducible protein A
LWQEEWVLVAIFIALQVIILPLFRFGVLTAALGAIHAGFDAIWIGPCFRWAEKIDAWAMRAFF